MIACETYEHTFTRILLLVSLDAIDRCIISIKPRKDGMARTIEQIREGSISAKPMVSTVFPMANEKWRKQWKRIGYVVEP